MNRWIELYATTPSGKTLFVCRVCGRITPAPTATCSAPPEVHYKMPLECALVEEMEGALAEGLQHPDRWERDKEGNDVRVLVISDQAERTPEGRRSRVTWSTRTTHWNSTEVYFEREEDKKNG